MKRMLCALLVLCLLLCPLLQVRAEGERPEPTTAEKAAALLYAGERVDLYAGRNKDAWGIIVEEFTWANKNLLYQPLPGTEGLEGLTVTGITPEGDEYIPSEAKFYIRYLDSDGQERVYCLDHPASSYPDFYPLSDEPALALAEDEKQTLEEVMVIGYHYDLFHEEDAEDDWEALCQRRILDALFLRHDDTLPPYLDGQADPEDEHRAIVTQQELEGFFQSVLGRPNRVPDQQYIDDEEQILLEMPDLQPGQVPLVPADWYVWAAVVQAVSGPEGSLTLYGYAHFGDGSGPTGVICRVTPTEGYLGWHIESMEVYHAFDLQFGSTVTFAPVKG